MVVGDGVISNAAFDDDETLVETIYTHAKVQCEIIITNHY